MPAEFIAQDPLIANPPTFFLAVEVLAKQAAVNAEANVNDAVVNSELSVVNEATITNDVTITNEGTMEIDEVMEATTPFLQDAAPRLWRWLAYLMRSQKSQLAYSFRWFGRSDRHCLASGLDDYPRHRIISEKESHVDLLAWIVYSLQVMSNVDSEHSQEARALLAELKPYLLEKHWDQEKHCFGDLGVIRQSEGKDEIGFETHVGYVSILPFALMLMESDDPRIPEILDIIEDPNQVSAASYSSPTRCGASTDCAPWPKTTRSSEWMKTTGEATSG